MILSKIYKRYKIIMGLLFFAIVMICSNIIASRAFTTYDIIGTPLLPLRTNNIIDSNKLTIKEDILQRRKFQITFFVPIKMENPEVLELYSVDNQHNKSLVTSVNNSNICDVGDEFYTCHITTNSFPEEGFIIKVLNKNLTTIKMLEGKKPTLEASLSDFYDDSYDTLILKNRDSKKTAVINTKNDTHISENQKKIAPHASYQVELSSKVNETIEITYAVDDEALESKINIVYFCGCALENQKHLLQANLYTTKKYLKGNAMALADKTGEPKPFEQPETLTDHNHNEPYLTLQLVTENGCPLRIKAPGNVTMVEKKLRILDYEITNTAEEKVLLTFSELPLGIYRDFGGNLNCDDVLMPNKSCILKLLVYPEEAMQIKQKLIVHSNAFLSSPCSSSADISVSVLKNIQPSNLQITLENQDDFDSAKFRVGFHNKSQQNILQITSVNLYRFSPYNKVKDFKYTKKLEPQNTEEMFFVPQGNLDKDNIFILEVKFKECTDQSCEKKEKLIKMPVLT